MKVIIIKDTVSIKATPSDIFHWFEHLDERYISWHPAHVSCRYLKKQTLEAGAAFHKRYNSWPGVRGSFQFLENEGGADVYAEVRIGWSLPFIGKFISLAYIPCIHQQAVSRSSWHARGRRLAKLKIDALLDTD